MIHFCISNAPPDAAARIARSLVEEKLAACVNIIPGVRSFYRWQGELCDDAESTLLIKTADANRAAFRTRFLELHPYECPELLVIPVEEGHRDYLDWVHDMSPPGAGGNDS